MGLLAFVLTASVTGRARASVGSEFLVNTYTTGSQSGAAVASDPTGRFVVVWQSSGQDGDSLGIFAQLFGADGSAAGAELQVNTYTTGSQSLPAVARDAAGGFLVVWQSAQPGDTSTVGITARLFDAAGAALTPEFRVNTYTTMQQLNAAVAAITGSFVVVWSSYGEDGSSHGIFGQRFSTAGDALGGEFRVNTYTTFAQLDPAVAATADGNGFLIVWDSFRDGSLTGIYGRRYAASGEPLTDEFRVNETTTNQQRTPSLAVDGKGSFLVAWHADQDGPNQVYAQRYSSSGAPAGGEFRVSTYTTGAYASVVGLADGGFVVAWQGPGDGSFDGILAQRYFANGAPDGSAFVLNTYTPSSQAGVSLARGLGGGFVAVWSSPGEDGSVDGIFGQQVVFAPPTEIEDFRVNTYTTRGQAFGAVALSSSGFVIVWTSQDQDGNLNGVYGQRFGAGGAALGDEFRVNTATAGAQKAAVVASLADGEFVVVFQDNPSTDVLGRRYAASGAPLGSEFRVNTLTTFSQAYPSVTGNASGFIVTWKSNGEDVSGNVQAQRYSAAGAPVGGEFRVNTHTTSSQGYASVGLRSSGEFVVVWQSYGQVSSYDVFGQRFDSSGSLLGGEFRVNTTTTGNQLLPRTAVDAAGRFVVVWGSSPSNGSSYDVLAQRFDASGQALGGEFRVNTYPTGITAHVQNQSIAAVAAGDSDFTVVWNSPSATHKGVFGQRFDFSGERIGPEFRVNISTAAASMRSIASDANGSFVVVYELVTGSAATSSFDVFRRRFAAFIPGDVDGNGSVNVADVFYLINFLFAGGPAPQGLADVDGNGAVDVADVFYLINFLFVGGPPPV